MSPMTWEEYSRGQDAVAEGEAMAEMIQAVLDAHDAENFARLNRSLYKYTDCGASLGLELWSGEMIWSGSPRLTEIQPGDVRAIGVGSIVEGVDEVVEHDFIYPEAFLNRDEEDLNPVFVAAYEAVVERVEEAAREIWDRTHGCDDCGPDDGWGRPINPECKTCHGEGTIL